MPFKIGEKVRYKHGGYSAPQEGVIVDVRAASVAIEHVSHTVFGRITSVYWCPNSDLIPIVDHTPCTCGSRTVGHPGHSYYCDIERNKNVSNFVIVGSGSIAPRGGAGPGSHYTAGAAGGVSWAFPPVPVGPGTGTLPPQAAGANGISPTGPSPHQAGPQTSVGVVADKCACTNTGTYVMCQYCDDLIMKAFPLVRGIP